MTVLGHIKISASIVFRIIGDELIVVNTKTGQFFHFAADAERFFKNINTMAVTSDQSVALNRLLEAGLISVVENAANSDEIVSLPIILRQGDSNLRDMAAAATSS